MTQLSTLSEIRHLICGKNQSCFLNLNMTDETLDKGMKQLVDCSAGKTQLVSFDGSLNSDATNTKILGLSLSSRFDWGPYLVSVVKTGSKGIGAFFRSIKFLSFEIVFYHYKFYKSAIRSCMEYSCHVWAGALSCHLDMCWINVRSGYAGLLVLHLLPLLSPWLIVEMII